MFSFECSFVVSSIQLALHHARSFTFDVKGIVQESSSLILIASAPVSQRMYHRTFLPKILQVLLLFVQQSFSHVHKIFLV